MTTPSQHLGATPKGYLSVITQCVSQGDCMHSEEQSVLEDPKKKKKRSKMTTHFKQIMYYLVLGPRPNGCSQFNLNISKLLSYFFQKIEINAIFLLLFQKQEKYFQNCQNPETCIRKEGHHRTSEGSLCNSLRQGTELSRL